MAFFGAVLSTFAKETFKPFLTNLLKDFGSKLLAASLYVFEPIYTTIKAWLFRLPLFLTWLATSYVLYSLLVSGLQALVLNFMPEITSSISLSMGWFLPSNTFECITLVYSSKLYRFAYDHKTAAASNKLRTVAS